MNDPRRARRRRTTASLEAVDSRRITASMPAQTDPVISQQALDSWRRPTAEPPAILVPPEPAAPQSPGESPSPSRAGFDLEDLEQTRRTLEQIFSNEPRNLDLVEAYVRVLVDLGRSGQASVELLWLAGFYADLGRTDSALRALAHAQRLEPRCMVSRRLQPLLRRLGPHGRAPCERAIEGHLAASRLTAARDLLELLVRTYPQQIDYRHRLAKLELLLGRTPVALTHLRIVIECYGRARCIPQLVTAAEEWLRHGGSDVELLWELARIYLQANLHERALDKLSLLHRLLPADLEVVERIANLQARLGRVETALATLWRLVREMRNAGADDERIRGLLERARYWNDTPKHQTSVDALARKVLALRGRDRIGSEGEAGRDYEVVVAPTPERSLILG